MHHPKAATPSLSVCQLLAALLDQFTLGIVVIDPNRRIISANRTARELMSTGQVLASRDGRLHAVESESEHSLTAAIERAAARNSDDPVGYFRLQELERAEMIHGYTTAIGPNGKGETEAVALVVYDARRTVSSERHLRRMFGLTAAEARVAALIAEGVQVADVAETLKISIHTVRTQLKNIFAKTGVGRQNELVRLATSGLALIADSAPHADQD